MTFKVRGGTVAPFGPIWVRHLLKLTGSVVLKTGAKNTAAVARRLASALFISFTHLWMSVQYTGIALRSAAATTNCDVRLIYHSALIYYTSHYPAARTWPVYDALVTSSSASRLNRVISMPFGGSRAGESQSCNSKTSRKRSEAQNLVHSK